MLTLNAMRQLYEVQFETIILIFTGLERPFIRQAKEHKKYKP